MPTSYNMGIIYQQEQPDVLFSDAPIRSQSTKFANLADHQRDRATEFEIRHRRSPMAHCMFVLAIKVCNTNDGSSSWSSAAETLQLPLRHDPMFYVHQLYKLRPKRRIGTEPLVSSTCGSQWLRARASPRRLTCQRRQICM